MRHLICPVDEVSARVADKIPHEILSDYPEPNRPWLNSCITPLSDRKIHRVRIFTSIQNSVNKGDFYEKSAVFIHDALHYLRL